MGVSFQVFDFDILYIVNKDISKYILYEVMLIGILLKYCVVEEMDFILCFLKVMMIDELEKLDCVLVMILVEVFECFIIMKSVLFYLEILSKWVDKGIGVKMLVDYLDILQENIMVLGDQGNDIVMVNYVGVGVVMGNVIFELKEIVQFVMGINSEDGVVMVIEKYVF